MGDEPDYGQLRTAFTASVSHELRTPLARLLALLEDAELPDADLQALLGRAHAEVEQMRSLVDDLLFLSELESGAEIVALGRTVALPVVEEVAGQLLESAARAGVTIVAGGNRIAAVPLRPRMLRVVVENLVENAIRYAGSGATLRLTIGTAGSDVVLAANDDGAGVSADDLTRLFERFYRGDRARTSRGTGLGLAIVKHVVTAAGGRVEARGAPAHGLEIRCVFPA